MLKPSPKDRRRHVRKRVRPETSFRIAAGQPVQASCKDMSLGGMFLRTPSAPPVGTALVVCVAFPGADDGLDLDAVVRWSGPEGMGVQFGALGARQTYLITEYLADAEPVPSSRFPLEGF
ncbi:MAG: PilZ domain-containing protein [Deltaproteobacteria bacterium]|nr:PilZ domain-containing protein [Deltaproteobacteria bacterium]